MMRSGRPSGNHMVVTTPKESHKPIHMHPSHPASPQRSGNLVDQMDRPDSSLRQEFGCANTLPLNLLKLNREHLLDTCGKRWTYWLIEWIMRLIPFLWIYGATVGLLTCITSSYRWGVLFALTMCNAWTSCQATLINILCIRSLFVLWANENTNWHQMWRNENPKSLVKCPSAAEMETEASEFSGGLKRNSSSGDMQDILRSSSNKALLSGGNADCLQWEDVFHVVIIASYVTPMDILEETLECLARYSSAKTNMGVVFAFEQKESGIKEKAEALMTKCAPMFSFVTATFHPSGLPGHIKGKASNMCWAFQELYSKELAKFGFGEADLFRICLTNMDDDSEFHDNYFDALTYHFLTAGAENRYLKMWQPPVHHLKNLARQPSLVRIGSQMSAWTEIAKCSNVLECHTLFSSNSYSLLLALAVGGWDPDWLSDDWHMMIKASVMSEGRVKVVPILLPLINLMPEEDTYCGTLKARFTQAKRHALGVSELAYMVTSIYLAFLECNTWSRSFRLLWRMAPMVTKCAEVHLMAAIYGFWPPVCAASNVYFSTWLQGDIASDQFISNSTLARLQLRIAALLACLYLVGMTISTVYVTSFRHRLHNKDDCFLQYRFLYWLRGWCDSIFGSLPQLVMFSLIPEAYASARILYSLKLDHAIASMIGRNEEGGDGF